MQPRPAAYAQFVRRTPAKTHFMQRSLPLLSVGLTVAWACATSTRLAQPTPDCAPGAPLALRSIDSTNVSELAGAFDVLMLNIVGTWGAPQTRLQLVLQPTDSTPTPRIGIFLGSRPLQGSAIYQGTSRGDTIATVMIGSKLYIGGFDMVDGGGDRLTPTDFTSEGFRGTWYFDGGIAIAVDPTSGKRIPDPKGIFCARRRSPGGA